MPSLELFVSPPRINGVPNDGNLVVNPPLPGLTRIQLRRLVCNLRAPPVPGVFPAVLDTGAHLTIIPYILWNEQFKWRIGRDYDELPTPDIGPLRGQVANNTYQFRPVRLRVPIELAGRSLGGDRLRLEGLVCQLADRDGPGFTLLGLWGGVLDNRKLVVERPPDCDDLRAFLHF